MAAITLLQAINQALDQAMANDERVVVYMVKQECLTLRFQNRRLQAQR